MPSGTHNYRYGWRRDVPDDRDCLYDTKCVVEAMGLDDAPILPTKADLRALLPACYDQGQLGSCTANAASGAVEYAHKKAGQPDFMPSRLFIYYNERAMEGTIAEDAGATIRDSMKAIAWKGVCTETTWPYVEASFAHKPTKAAYDEGIKVQSTQYLRVDQNLNAMKTCIAIDGYPICIGISVYQSFESEAVASSGMVPMPKAGEQCLGGHAVLVVGYDDTIHLPGSNGYQTQGAFLVRNSWGTSWGINGCFYLAYDYVTNPSLASDFWTLRKLEA